MKGNFLSVMRICVCAMALAQVHVAGEAVWMHRNITLLQTTDRKGADYSLSTCLMFFPQENNFLAVPLFGLVGTS